MSKMSIDGRWIFALSPYDPHTLHVYSLDKKAWKKMQLNAQNVRPIGYSSALKSSHSLYFKCAKMGAYSRPHFSPMSPITLFRWELPDIESSSNSTAIAQKRTSAVFELDGLPGAEFRLVLVPDPKAPPTRPLASVRLFCCRLAAHSSVRLRSTTWLEGRWGAKSGQFGT
ncbi:hypothetical protein M3Y99_00819600 [Aphelenchoides fujianensis]|nr:hypothetical protein M3Y99_00819600 [Aphelenchoides fujianensis]